jgi:hypothetical protein
MKSLLISLTILGLALPFGTIRAEEKSATVVVPLDKEPFKVRETDLIRVTGEGPAGSKIAAKVEGPAKITSTDTVYRRKNGRPVIGVAIKEFVLQPTGKGKVTVNITVTRPIAEPEETKYVFEVE